MDAHAGLVREALLVGAVVGIGVLHTIVPDHWVPIALVARQQGWSRAQTARAALQAGTGHVLSTLLIGAIVWAAGVAVARAFGHVVALTSSLALVGFGLWVAVGAWRELHSHPQATANNAAVHEQGPSRRTALLFILGSSPMVEGIPAFFAAASYGFGLIAVMAVAFAVATIATYVGLTVSSTAGLQRLKLGAFERYGELASGAFIAVVGIVFFFVPVF